MQVSSIAVMAEYQRDLVRVLNQSGPPDQLYLKSHGKVQNEFRNKTWIYDFKGTGTATNGGSVISPANFSADPGQFLCRSSSSFCGQGSFIADPFFFCKSALFACADQSGSGWTTLLKVCKSNIK